VVLEAAADAEPSRSGSLPEGEPRSTPIKMRRATIQSIAGKIGCSSEALRKWVRQAERDRGRRPGLTTEERERLRVLEREVRELRRANEILRKASAYFAQAELDRRPK
jgi:transposase